MIEIPFNTTEFKRDSKKVYLLQKGALEEAVRYTLNEMAFQTWKMSKRDLKKHFTLRNTWTARSLAFEKVPANVRDIDRMESHAGSREKYLEEQEDGVQKVSKGKHGLAIPTTYAAGQGGSKTRTKKVTRKYYLSRLRPARGLYDDTKDQAANKAQHLSLMVNQAKKLRKKIIYWETLRGKKGLFKIDGDRLYMVYSLTERRITSRARPWLSDPTAKVGPMLRKIYGKALRFQLSKFYK